MYATLLSRTTFGRNTDVQGRSFNFLNRHGYSTQFDAGRRFPTSVQTGYRTPATTTTNNNSMSPLLLRGAADQPAAHHLRSSLSSCRRGSQQECVGHLDEHDARPAGRFLRRLLSVQCERVSSRRVNASGGAGQLASDCHSARAAERRSR